jgi:endonuclease/exonuclease/phosphatase family metal-dependent hydrolase
VKKSLLLLFCLVVAAKAPAREIRIAAFNLGWAGTLQDYQRHVQVCANKAVNWCKSRGNTQDRKAQRCRDAFQAAAGGETAARGIAPCNAYEKFLLRKDDPSGYIDRLRSLRATMLGDEQGLGISDPRVDLWAVSEVANAQVFDEILGKKRNEYHVCITQQAEFQKVGFVWKKNLGAGPQDCQQENGLAVADDPDLVETPEAPFDLQQRRLRAGMSLTLSLNGQPVTFMSLHLKSGCVNPEPERFAGRKQDARPLTSDEPACRLLRAQVKPLEDWMEAVARKTPRFVMIGDFNRKLHQEIGRAARQDGTSAAATIDPPGAAPSRIAYLYPELNDGHPAAARTWLLKPAPDAQSCQGFTGLDHIVVSLALAELNDNRDRRVEKLSLARTPSGRLASDHCPLAVRLNF